MDSFTSFDFRTHHVSEAVFVGLCHIFGTSQQVTMRRELVDMREMMTNQIKNDDRREMLSGSRREGFRIKGSDVDKMLWFNEDRVIWNLNQTQKYNLDRQGLILADCSESPPGFTLLQVITPTNNQFVISACIRMNEKFYISSSKYRQVTLSHVLSDSTEHGPCSYRCIESILETDFAHCFVCDSWPPSASKWIERCHSWPQPLVVQNILREGCHVVAMGHKLGNHADNEWRISFSMAEQKLVNSMNHCQFLTYGLLKLFLKEVINNAVCDSDKLLCSYHIKTAVIWVIQQNTIPCWCPQNLLECFWVCFKLILQWTYEGVCPNFFIPQNNMFLINIHGGAQNKLFKRLYKLYTKGLKSLLRSPSISSYILDALSNPTLSICTDEQTFISKTAFDIEVFEEVHLNDLPLSLDLHQCMRYLYTIEQRIHTALTKPKVILLQKLTTIILQSIAFTLHNMLLLLCLLPLQPQVLTN